MGMTVMQYNRQSDIGTGSFAIGQTVIQLNRQSGSDADIL
jgi:hypothetical protein